jgi:hypothetical protein
MKNTAENEADYSKNLLISGYFNKEDIIVSRKRSDRETTPVLETKIKKTWKEIKKFAKESGKNCYDGTNYRLNNLTYTHGKLNLEVSTIKYRVTSSLQLLTQKMSKSLSVKKKHNVCSCGSAVRTKDGKYVVAELSGKSMNSNRLELLGGMVEKPLPLTNSKELFDHLYSELKEEAFINKKDVGSIILRAVMRSAGGTIVFHFDTKLNLTSKTIRERFIKNKNRDPDIADLLFLSKKDFVTYLKTSDRVIKNMLVDFI